MTNTNEFLVWDNGTPVVCMVTDLEFDVWSQESPTFSPVEDIDESWAPTPVTVTRRRVYIF